MEGGSTTGFEPLPAPKSETATTCQSGSEQIINSDALGAPYPARSDMVGHWLDHVAFLSGKRCKQCTDVSGVLKHPERLQNGISFLARPAVADVTAKFAVDVRLVHRLTRKAGNVVDLAADAPAVGQ